MADFYGFSSTDGSGDFTGGFSEISAPSAFTFLPVIDANLSTVYYGTSLLLGAEPGALMEAVNGEVSNNNITWSSSCDFIDGRTYARVTLESSSLLSTTNTKTMSVNGVSSTFTVTTTATASGDNIVQIPSRFDLVVTRGYSTAGPDGAKRTQVAGGRSRYSLDYDRGSMQFSCALILDMLQWQVWESFYLIVIKKGTIPFKMWLDSGTGKSLHVVNIVPGSYSVNLDLVKYASVSFTVETESKIYDDPDFAIALIDLYNYYGGFFGELLAALEYLANVQSDVLEF